MDSDGVTEKHEVVTEEPAPDWWRYEVEGSTPWYKTPVPRTVLKSSRKVALFLEKEHSKGRMKDVDVSQFSFKRRLGLLKMHNSGSHHSTQGLFETQTLDLQKKEPPKTIVERLTKSVEAVNHRKVLSEAAKSIDVSRASSGYETPENFDSLKKALTASVDLRNNN